MVRVLPKPGKALNMSGQLNALHYSTVVDQGKKRRLLPTLLY